MNTFFKLQLTITVAALFFFNAAIAKEGSIRIIPINTNPVKAPIELSPVMVNPKFPTKAPVKPIAAPIKPILVPTKPILVPTKPIAVPTKPIAVSTKPTAFPNKPIAAPTKAPLRRFPTVIAGPALIEIPFSN